MNPMDLEVRPDEKGPKNSPSFCSRYPSRRRHGWQDWQLHNEGLTDEQIETFLATPNSQPGEPTTVDQYRDFETDVRETTATCCRRLLASLVLVFVVGAPMLYRLQRNGAVVFRGALIGLVGGLLGSITINDAAQTHLGDAMKLTYEIWAISAVPRWGCVSSRSPAPQRAGRLHFTASGIAGRRVIAGLGHFFASAFQVIVHGSVPPIAALPNRILPADAT